MRLIASLLRPFRRGHVRARYEAGVHSAFRSWYPSPIQSAAKDVATDRQTLLNLARRWDHNSPLIAGILEKVATHTIGTGLNPIPNSGSARWNKQVARKWRNWARKPELTDRFSWGTVQRILWRSALRDGDAFLLLTTREDGAPAVQMIEGHRIREPNVYQPRFDPTDPGDGVVRDPVGKHVFYKLVNEADGKLERNLDGTAVVQILLPQRPDQPRGVTIFASALKTVHNLDDILRLEQLAVKDSASKVDIIETESGELPLEETGTIDGVTSGQDAAGYYHNVFGPESKVLKRGDSWKGYEPKRPGPAWQGFVEFLTAMIGFSTGLPPTFLVPAKIGGADTRAILAAAARTLEVWQWAQADSYQRVYEFVVQSWIDRGEIGNAPKDWDEVTWQMPRSITADAGRDARADLDKVAAGLMTLEQYFGELGLVATEEVEKLAIEDEKILERSPSLHGRLYSKPGTAQEKPEEEAPEDEEKAPEEEEDETNTEDNQPD